MLVSELPGSESCGAYCIISLFWLVASRQASNYGPIAQRKINIVGGPVPRHFDVGALLKMTTGWTLGHLSSLVRLAIGLIRHFLLFLCPQN